MDAAEMFKRDVLEQLASAKRDRRLPDLGEIILAELRRHGLTPTPENAERSTLNAQRSSDEPFGDRKAIPPQPEWVAAYSKSIDYPMDGQAWCDQYAAKGWVVGKTKMKDWQAAVRNWKSNKWGLGTITIGTKANAMRAAMR